VVVEEGEKIQTKENDNLLNKIIANNFPNLKKERVLQVQKAYKASNHKDKRWNTPPQTHHNQNTQQTDQRKNSKSCKRLKTSHT
jgi:hypothetical protein